jgi:hypothetical protein
VKEAYLIPHPELFQKVDQLVSSCREQGQWIKESGKQMSVQFKGKCLSWAWWYIPVIPELKAWRQED